MTRNVPGSIPGVTCIFFSYLGVWGVILVPCADLKFGITITVGTPPAGRFGMLCSCILQSHATRTERHFLFQGGKLCFNLSTPCVCHFWCFCVQKVFLRNAGRGGTWWLVPLYEVLVVPEVAQLLLIGGQDLAELVLPAGKLVDEVPIGDENALLLHERGRPGAGVA